MPISYEAVFNRLSPRKRRKSIRWILGGLGLALAVSGAFWWSARRTTGERTAEEPSRTDSPIADATIGIFDMDAAMDTAGEELTAMAASASGSAGTVPSASVVASVTLPSPVVLPVVRAEERPAPQPLEPSRPVSPARLEDAMAELKAIDRLLPTDPEAARDRLAALIPTIYDPAIRAQALYRQGYASARLQDEAGAETAWLRAAAESPESRDGRQAALAAADLWAKKYFVGRRDPSKFENIQTLYSIALGTDDGSFMKADTRKRVVGMLHELAGQLVFGNAPLSNPVTHTVREGENLSMIAKQYRVEFEAIALANDINPNSIRAGKTLRIPVGEVSVVVRKNMANRDEGPRLQWFLDGKLIREYAACVGDGDKTPAGVYEITVKSMNPEWTDPKTGMRLPYGHPDNILGTRWMAMKKTGTSGLGIHGTTLPGSIPGYTSAGCVRLLNKHAEELYAFLRSGGKVTIVD